MEFPRSEKLIAHVDMNSYFASVEQQANPFLRGRPLGVCAYLHEYGCVIAASIEAKKLGMKVGMTVKQAREAVPNAVFVQNDPPKYRAVTSRVFSLLHEMTDRMERYSIDEAFLDLTGWYRDAAEASFAFSIMKKRITEEVGEWLRCSVGIAPTRFLAKTASDLKKPDGLTIIDFENLDRVLARLDLEDVCGIGPRLRKRIEKLGYRNLIQVKYAPTGNLIRMFGVYGYFLKAKLHGLDVDHLEQQEDDRPPKSIGHSYCVPERVNRDGKIVSTLMKLTERAGRRMRALGLQANAISVSVGLKMDGGPKPQGPFWRPSAEAGGTVHFTFPEPTDDSFTLIETSTNLLRELWHREKVNFLAITLFDLSVPTRQTALDLRMSGLREAMQPERRQAVSKAVDLIRDRYGLESIVLGDMMRLGDEAPDRIGFRKTEGVDIVQKL